jgi:probable F420-dependent oxidoreductase
MSNSRNYWQVVMATNADALTRIVREAEDAGLEGIWAPQLHSPPFVTLAAAAMVSKRILLGTGIALAFTRSPVETALSALDLDTISGGRTVLGLGTSIRAFNENVHGVVYGKPVAHLREVVKIVRAITTEGHSGKLGKFDGQYHRVDLSALRTGKLVRDRIPIWLPPLFEPTVRLAADVADGLTGHPVWSAKWIANEVNRNVSEGLAKSGRKRTDFKINLWIYTAINKDRQKAIDDARGTVAFYSQIAQYEKYFAAHGFGENARAVQAAAARKDFAAMRKAVPDEMVTTFALAGTPDDAREQIEAYWKVADSITLTPPNAMLDGATHRAYQQAIADTFYGR